MQTREMSLRDRARNVVEAQSENFVELIKVAGLDPSRDLRFSNWSDVSFKGLDIRGFDFSGSRLTDCNFAEASIKGARFEAADIRGSNLRSAKDWAAYVKAWTPPQEPVGTRHLRDGSVFQDAPFAPEMVLVPQGEFQMGSPPGEGDEDEHHQHKVTIARPFAVGRFAVTFDEWDAAYGRGGVRHHPGDEDWGRGRRPVINVSWEDAKAYVGWLSQETGKDYRLLTEAEWEYCCRAGTATKYSFGDAIDHKQAQFAADKTAEAGSFPANAWGLHDMHGNVWEWCEDNWHGDYSGNPPSDGSVWPGGDASFRVLRGGSWGYFPQYLRSAGRDGYQPGNRFYYVGFRVARTL